MSATELAFAAWLHRVVFVRGVGWDADQTSAYSQDEGARTASRGCPRRRAAPTTLKGNAGVAAASRVPNIAQKLHLEVESLAGWKLSVRRNRQGRLTRVQCRHPDPQDRALHDVASTSSTAGLHHCRVPRPSRSTSRSDSTAWSSTEPQDDGLRAKTAPSKTALGAHVPSHSRLHAGHAHAERRGSRSVLAPRAFFPTR
ncbi:hypothetical protein K438DRAFT_2018080 [Mycena galopus ATCC 62051]|nr:hypothetical protein K438DRAFT_2018080 [Mycena galopus ATCC 62051]